MKKSILTYILGTCVVTLFSACKPEFKQEENSPGSIDATSFVMIGGGSVSGFMDDALYFEGQKNALAQLIAQQLELVGGKEIHQPYVSQGSNGLSLEGNARFKLNYRTDCKDISALSPVRAAASGDLSILNDVLYNGQKPFGNFGVPDLRLLQVNEAGYGTQNGFFGRIMSAASASVLSDALAANPTFFALYLGVEDVLSYAKSGGKNNSELPSLSEFQTAYEEIVNAFIGLGCKGAISLIPDVTQMPYFTTIPYNGLTLDAENAQTLNNIYNPLDFYFEVGSNPFMIEDGNANQFGIRQILEGEKLLLSLPLDSVKCNQMGTLFPIRNEFVLTLEEIAFIQTRIQGYNSIITTIANQHNLALVRADAFYDKLQSGFMYNGVSMSSTFVSGGAYSLDGIYFNAKGNALLANEFLKAINIRYNSTIPALNAGYFNATIFP